MKQVLIILLLLFTILGCEEEKYTGSVKFIFYYCDGNDADLGTIYIYLSELPERYPLITNPTIENCSCKITDLNPGNYIVEHDSYRQTFQVVAGKEQVVHLY